jgi:hypothetical protein
MNDLLFLAMYGEGPTGHIVARYLSSPNTTAVIAPGLNEMQVFESPIHNNRLVDLQKFARFVSRQCKIQIALRTGPHVFPWRLPIQHFANSVHDMWNDDAPLVLGRLKQHYLVDYAALPSNTRPGPAAGGQICDICLSVTCSKFLIIFRKFQNLFLLVNSAWPIR